MLQRGVEDHQAVEAYLRVDFERDRQIGRIFEITMDRQRRRDELAGVSIADSIMKRFREERLFYSAGHPTEPLLKLIARSALGKLADQRKVEEALEGHCEAFTQSHCCPIHPNLARYYGLAFAHEYSRYGMNSEGRFTFLEYIWRYMRGESTPELQEAFDAVGSSDSSALAKLELALKKLPHSPSALRVHSSLLRKVGRAAEAVSSAWQAAVIEPDGELNAIELVYALLADGQSSIAERIALVAIERFPRRLEAFQTLADVLFATNRDKEALPYLAHAVSLRPGDTSGILKLARCHYRLGDYIPATELARRALSFDPNLIAAHVLLAELLEKQQCYDEAVKLLQLVISTDDIKGRVDAHILLANLQRKLNNYEAAEATLLSHPNGREHPQLLAAMADIYMQLGRITVPDSPGLCSTQSIKLPRATC